jgi:hypothetical protein
VAGVVVGMVVAEVVLEDFVLVHHFQFVEQLHIQLQ